MKNSEKFTHQGVFHLFFLASRKASGCACDVGRPCPHGTVCVCDWRQTRLIVNFVYNPCGCVGDGAVFVA